MKRRFLFFLFFGVLVAEVQAGLEFNGIFRGDAVLSVFSNRNLSGGALEIRLKPSVENEIWRFFGDASGFLLTGASTNHVGTLKVLLRSLYVRFNSGIGGWTFGRSYVRSGPPGIFNPMEMDKTIDFSDLTKEHVGSDGIQWEDGIGNLSTLKAFLSMGPDVSVFGGAGAIIHTGTSEIHALVARKAKDINVAGLAWRGDLLLGVRAAYVLHFEDNPAVNFNEATLGLDYSFFDGHLILSATGYWTERGSDVAGQYSVSVLDDRFLSARWYGYADATARFDEFTSASIDAFVNGIDGSCLFYTSVSSTVANGLTLTGLVGMVTGHGSDEFSRTLYGNLIMDLRIEARM